MDMLLISYRYEARVYIHRYTQSENLNHGNMYLIFVVGLLLASTELVTKAKYLNNENNLFYTHDPELDQGYDYKKPKVNQIVLPLRSGTMLKNLFHLPFYVTYKRSLMGQSAGLQEFHSGPNPHVRVIKRDPEEPLYPMDNEAPEKKSGFSKMTGGQDFHIMREELGSQIPNRFLRSAESDFAPHVRVMKSQDFGQPHIRVMRSGYNVMDADKLDDSYYDLMRRSPHLRVVRSENPRHIRVTK